MTLSDLKDSHALQYDYSYSCSSVDKISIDVARRAVPLQADPLVFR